MKFSIFNFQFSKKFEQKGFTLIEMLVSVAIFTFVMLIATSSIFTIVTANKKAESLRLVMDNLDFALESITRNIRTGNAYSCLSGGSSGGSEIGNCSQGATGFEFVSNQSNGASIEYYLSNGKIMEDETGWSNPVSITAAEIQIYSLEFYLIGSGKDMLQPRVLMTVIGTAGTSTTQTQFKIQTTLSQRQIDS